MSVHANLVHRSCFFPFERIPSISSSAYTWKTERQMLGPSGSSEQTLPFKRCIISGKRVSSPRDTCLNKNIILCFPSSLALSMKRAFYDVESSPKTFLTTPKEDQLSEGQPVQNFLLQLYSELRSKLESHYDDLNFHRNSKRSPRLSTAQFPGRKLAQHEHCW